VQGCVSVERWFARDEGALVTVGVVAMQQPPRPECFPRSEEGALLWPQRFSAATIADLKHTLGTYVAAGQLQQQPAPAGGGIFRRVP
jgi:hypothetical protein